MLSLLLALAAASTPAELLKQGMEAQKAGRADDAHAAYTSCLEADPNHAGCHWEMGWNRWTAADWAGVVKHWTEVQRLDPERTDLGKYLPTAKGHLAALESIKGGAEGSPDTVRAPLPEGKTLRLRAVGDIMMGTDFPGDHLPPEDGATMLTPVADWLRDADLTFGNLEGPLCDGGKTSKCSPGQNCYAFRTPTRYGAYLKDAGFDVMSTANNHAEDFGMLCREQTEKTLGALDIAFSGRPGTIASVEVDGMKVAMIGFHTNPNSHYVNDHATAKTLVAALDKQHDYVIVSFHGGAEGSKALHTPDAKETFYGENRGHLRKFARDVIGAGADIVLGHGPHVPRGMEVVDGHLVAYSMGNFATYGRFNLSGFKGISMVLEATLDSQGKLVSGKLLPVKLIDDGFPVPDPENTVIDLVRDLSTTDFKETAPTIAKDGSFVP